MQTQSKMFRFESSDLDSEEGIYRVAGKRVGSLCKCFLPGRSNKLIKMGLRRHDVLVDVMMTNVMHVEQEVVLKKLNDLFSQERSFLFIKRDGKFFLAHIVNTFSEDTESFPLSIDRRTPVNQYLTDFRFRGSEQFLVTYVLLDFHLRFVDGKLVLVPELVDDPDYCMNILLYEATTPDASIVNVVVFEVETPDNTFILTQKNGILQLEKKSDDFDGVTVPSMTAFFTSKPSELGGSAGHLFESYIDQGSYVTASEEKSLSLVRVPSGDAEADERLVFTLFPSRICQDEPENGDAICGGAKSCPAVNRSVSYSMACHSSLDPDDNCDGQTPRKDLRCLSHLFDVCDSKSALRGSYDSGFDSDVPHRSKGI